MYTACIFDLDGTLTDTLESLTYSVNETLKELGLSEITREQCRAFVGNGARVLIEKSLEAAGDSNMSRVEEAMQVYDRIFSANCTYQVAPYEGIPELLQNLKERNIRLAVLSNKPHSQTKDVVRTFFGTDTFEWVQGQQEGIPRKPDPAAACQIAERFHVPCSECIYVGDSEVDMMTGNAAGMYSVGVTWGFRSRDILEAHGARDLIDRPEEFLTIINEKGAE